MPPRIDRSIAFARWHQPVLASNLWFIRVSLPRRHLSRFSRLCRAHGRVQHIHTD